MIQDVADQGIDGLVRTQDGLHLAQFSFTFLDDIGVRALGHEVIFLVDQAQGVLIQLQVDDPALIVDRTGGSVLHGLGHVVDVDVVAEHFPCAAVLGGDGGSGKTDVSRIGKAVPDDAGGADGSVDLQLTPVVLPGDHLFGQAILPTVGLVRHDHDIPPLRQGLASFLKLLHGGKDDAVGMPARQQILQVLPAFGLLGRLTQKVLTAGKLPVELIVQVVAICDDHDGGTLQRPL